MTSQVFATCRLCAVERYGEALRSAGVACPASAAQAMSITRELEPCVAPVDRLGEALACLLAMAERRSGTEPAVQEARGA